MLVLLGLLFAVIVLLALPLELRFDARWPDTRLNRAELRWAFGIVRVDLPAGEASDEERTARASPRSRASRPRKRPTSIMRALRMPQLRRRVTRFLGDLWRAVHKESVRIDCRVGLENPADTGMLWGVMGPVAGALQTATGCQVVLQPVFSHETVEIHGQGSARAVPLRVLGLVFGLLVSPTVWRGVLASRSGR